MFKESENKLLESHQMLTGSIYSGPRPNLHLSVMQIHSTENRKQNIRPFAAD